MSENISGTQVTITEIMDFLPHRYPFLFLVRVVEMDGEKSGVGIKNVTASEPWFTGHFPENPVFPGVLIIEAIAQVSAILVLQHAKDSGNPMETKLIYFMTVDKVRFRHPVTPGDQMRIHVTQIRRRGMAYKFKGEVFVDGQLMAEGEIMAVNHDPSK